jgi:hypothetical protein
MKKEGNVFSRSANRRSFLKGGTAVAGAATLGAALLPDRLVAFDDDDDRAPVTRGDIAILTFLSAVEQVEADLWLQYAELGGVTTNPAVTGGEGLAGNNLKFNGKLVNTGVATNYVLALQVLDTDMPQYITDNTDDEISHHRFLNNYLVSKGGRPIDLSEFAILSPSLVSGVPQNPRLTNLKQLTIDTTFWQRYRSSTMNPDFGGKFENAVPDLAKGQHPAIPVNDGDLVLNPDGTITNHLQAIANTAGFHFAFIEQGGTSLYPTLAQKVTNLEVLRVLLSIGGSETMHFQTWHDKAGNATNISDPTQNLTFPNLNDGMDPNPNGTSADPASDFQTNLVMPEPTLFLSKSLGPVAIIRPTADFDGGAAAAVQSLADDGLFFNPNTGQNTDIVRRLMELAEAADAARRGF